MEKDSSQISAGGHFLIHNKGSRAYQEDRYSHDEILPGVFWMAVYDGHGGEDVSELARSVLPQVLTRHLHSLPVMDNAAMEKFKSHICSVIEMAFLEADRQIFDQLQARYAGIGAAQVAIAAGSTVSGVLRFGSHVFVVNLGDSATVIVSKTRGTLFVTSAHKPLEYHERKRIERSGGWVRSGDMSFFQSKQPARVNGILAVSRSLGKFFLTQQVTEKVF